MDVQRLTAVVLLALVVAGCGGSGDKFDNPPPTHDPAHIATSFGCQNPTVEPEPELYVSDAVNCTYNGGAVTVNTFGSSTTEDNWRKVAGQFGAGTIVVGDGYVVEANTGRQARAIAAALGASVE